MRIKVIFYYTVLYVHASNSVSVYMQEYEENPSILYSAAHPRGVIQPYSTEQIPLVLQAKAVGQLHLTVLIAILGQQDPPLVSLSGHVFTHVQYDTEIQAERMNSTYLYAHSVFNYINRTTNWISCNFQFHSVTSCSHRSCSCAALARVQLYPSLSLSYTLAPSQCSLTSQGRCSCLTSPPSRPSLWHNWWV